MPHRISRAAPAGTSGPGVGDTLRLADTDLVIAVEQDFTLSAEAVRSGDGVGRSQISRGEGAVDTVITNALIIDHWGIVKADIGIKDGRIAGIGRAGDPDAQPGIDIIVGPGTEMIAGAGRIVTAGGLDTHGRFLCPRQVEAALMSGVTTMLGGGTGPAAGTDATGGTPGPWHLGRMLQAAEGFPMNLAFAGNGNAALPGALEEEVRGGAAALTLDDERGKTAAAIDCCLDIAEAFDVPVMIPAATLNRSGSVADAIGALRGRTVHAVFGAGTGGGHASDITGLAALANVLPSSTTRARPCTINTVDAFMARHRLDPAIPGDMAVAERRILREAIAAEDILHDMGALAMTVSGGTATGPAGEVVLRTWQTAHAMKAQRGRLPEDRAGDDNFRVKRYVAKYTINPAIAHGLDEWVGSVTIGKLADLVIWSPAFFGVRPDLVIKLGVIAADWRPTFGGVGKAMTHAAVTFASQAAVADDLAADLGLSRQLLPVRHTRGITKESMIHNSAMPTLEVDPETCAVRADGELLTAAPAEVLPMAQRYFLF